MDGGIYQCKPFYRRFQEKVWGYARGNITITMYLGNRLLRWLVIFFYFIINYAGKQNQFVLYYIMRTCFFTHHMHLFAIVNWVACSSLMGYLVHRYIVSISVRQRTVGAAPVLAAGDPLAVINNLSTFIFSLIRAIGLILLGFGVVQVGLSLKSHDPSQRANGFLTLAGGVIITFAKEILDLIVG